MRRWLRCLVCLLVICALLVNLIPVKAEATAAGAVGIAKASLVTGNPAIIVGTALLAVGVAAGVESGAFENLVDNAVSYLDEAGGWIADGSMQLLQTVTEAGQTAYYVAGDLLETLRSWLFSEKVVSSTAPYVATEMTCSWDGNSLFFVGSVPFALYGCNYIVVEATRSYTNSVVYAVAESSGRVAKNSITNYSYTSLTKQSSGIYAGSVTSSTAALDPSKFVNVTYLEFTGSSWNECNEQFLNSVSFSESINTDQDLTLGNVSSVPIDGTSARSWAPDVADRNGLYVKYNNDPDPPDDNNGNWFWRLALPLTILDLIAMSQADEWTGESPEEFPTGDTVTEFEILDRPEIDGYQGIEVSPVTDPDTNPDTGEGADPTEPGEPTEPSEGESGDSSGGSETNWFQKIWKSIEELPNKFKTWFSDLKTAIEELPSKLKSLGTEIITAIQNLPQTFANLFADVVAAIQSVPQAIKEFFTPKTPDTHEQFALVDLSDYFPFCIPFDLFDFFTLLNADPVAPVLSWEFRDLSGQVYALSVDLSEWDSVAQLFRRLQLFLFVCGLAAASRKYIKW